MHRKLTILICAALIVTTCLPACSAQSDTQQTNTSVAAEKITLTRVNTGKLTMAKGTTYDIDVVADPSDATLFYTSSDEKVATVSDSGMISAQTVGMATITVKAVTGDITKHISLKVVKESQYVAVKSIEPIHSKLSLYTTTGKKLGVRFTPSNVSNENLTYTSSDPSVVSVSAAGKIITHISGKTAVITIRSAETSEIKTKISVYAMPYSSPAYP